MRTITAGVLSAALLVAFTGAGIAETKSQKHRRTYDDSSKYPGATPRQLRNARAYERGEYYEMDSNAHPVGSRSWWALKERESGDRWR